MAKNQKLRWALLIIAIIIFITQINTLPKLAVSDVEGRTCTIDADCPCVGEIEVDGKNITNFGIGAGECNEGTCDMTLCIDVAPVGTWFKENPFQWFKEHLLVSLLIVGLIILVVQWPKI